uniref:P-type domain-containing protein n=1 Tax=Monopterus albus TaxID=43700 RepID=A0A3Q3IGA5_MONAL
KSLRSPRCLKVFLDGLKMGWCTLRALRKRSSAYCLFMYLQCLIQMICSLITTKPQNSSVKKRGIHINFQETDISKNTKCTMAPESRFDCARDRLLSQRECEERGCCYVPLPNTAGPPWCFYPSWYPGYSMGPLTPTRRGQAATLTRALPSYLPRDISTLNLEVIEETNSDGRLVDQAKCISNITSRKKVLPFCMEYFRVLTLFGSPTHFIRFSRT